MAGQGSPAICPSADWRGVAGAGREFDAEAAALEYAQTLGAREDEDEDKGAAAQQGKADEEAAEDEDEETQPAEAVGSRAVAGKAILKAYTNTIPPQEGPKNCAKCRSGRGVCRKPGANGHLQLRGAEMLQLLPRPKKRALAAADGVPAQVVSSLCPPAKRPAPSVVDRQQQLPPKPQPQPQPQPQQPSVARSGRVRKAVSRWSEDPLSSVNLGGRQELLTAVVTGAVSSEKEFHEAKLAKQREEQAMFRAEQDRVRQEEAEARREAAARLEAMRELQEAAVAGVKKGFAAKSQAGFDKSRVEYLQGISALRSELGLAVAPTQREHAGVGASEGATAVAAAFAAYDKASTESEWLQHMQRMCRQQAGVILMQQQQRLREQELAAAHIAAKLELGGSGETDEPRQRSRRVHPSIKKQR